jgi:nickel/cobalt transporter (NiCoT) family protein
MTLIDSLDSILMLYSYSGFPENSWAIFERTASVEDEDEDNRAPVTQFEAEEPISSEGQTTTTTSHLLGSEATSSIQEISRTDEAITETSKPRPLDSVGDVEADPGLKSDTKASVREDRVARDLQVKRNMMSGLSIILTLMSILVAFR